MRLETVINSGMIESASWSQTKYALSLIINTRDKNVWPDMIIQDEKLTFYFYSSTTSRPDYVRLVPEDDKEKEILGRIMFCLHDKDQLWYLFCDKSVYCEWYEEKA